jgi:hypothetical protein
MTAGPILRASCACGQVAIEARGAPMFTAVCYCDDCQAAGHEIEALAGAPRVLDADAGTPLVMFRKDRLAVVRGQDRLEARKLNPGSATSRYVAACCNSAMYLGFDDMKHWVDIFRGRIEGAAPEIQARVCTRFRPAGTAIPTDAPAYERYPLAMMVQLLRSRMAMLFGR